MLLYSKPRLIDLKHNVHTQTQIVWIMHAKIYESKTWSSNAQLKKRLWYKLKQKIKLNKHATKPYSRDIHSLPLNVSETCNFILSLFYAWKAFTWNWIDFKQKKNAIDAFLQFVVPPLKHCTKHNNIKHTKKPRLTIQLLPFCQDEKEIDANDPKCKITNNTNDIPYK